MRDKEFEILLTDVIREYGANYIELPERKYDKPHEFSAGFEKKMQRLIRRERKFYFPLVKTPIRRAVTVILTIIAALMATVMSVGALREPFVHFITEIFDTHTRVQSLDYKNVPMFIDTLYEITELPEGMELTESEGIDEYAASVFQEYRNETGYIYFNQYSKPSYKQNVNTEGYEMIPIDINGNEGFLIDYGKQCLIIWDNGDYILLALGNIDKNLLISAAKSVKKVE